MNIVNGLLEVDFINIYYNIFNNTTIVYSL